jgi:hypothetical protein
VVFLGRPEDGPSAGSRTDARDRSHEMQRSESRDVVTCEVGMVSGEDYNFRFSGKIRDGKLHFRLHMEYEVRRQQGQSKQGSTATRLSRMFFGGKPAPGVTVPDTLVSEDTCVFVMRLAVRV